MESIPKNNGKAVKIVNIEEKDLVIKSIIAERDMYQELLKEREYSIVSLKHKLDSQKSEHDQEIDRYVKEINIYKDLLKHKDLMIKSLKEDLTEHFQKALNSFIQKLESEKNVWNNVRNAHKEKEELVLFLEKMLEESDLKAQKDREQTVEIIKHDKHHLKNLLDENRLIKTSIEEKLRESIPKIDHQRYIRIITNEKDVLYNLLVGQKKVIKQVQNSHFETIATTEQNLALAGKIIIEGNDKFRHFLEEKNSTIESLHSELRASVPKTKLTEAVALLSKEIDNFKCTIEEKDSLIASLNNKIKDSIEKHEHNRMINLITEEKDSILVLLHEKELVIHSLNKDVIENLKSSEDAIICAFNLEVNEKDAYETLIKEKDSHIECLNYRIKETISKAEQDLSQALNIIEHERNKYKTCLKHSMLVRESLKQKLFETVPRLEFDKVIRLIKNGKDKYKDIMLGETSMLYSNEDISKPKLEQDIDMFGHKSNKYQALWEEKELIIEFLRAKLKASMAMSDHSKAIALISKEKDEYENLVREREAEIELLKVKLKDSVPIAEHSQVVSFIANERDQYKELVYGKNNTIQTLNKDLIEHFKTASKNALRTFEWRVEERERYQQILKQKELINEHLSGQLNERILRVEKEYIEQVKLITCDRDHCKTLLGEHQLELTCLKEKLMESVPKSELDSTLQDISDKKNNYVILLENQESLIKRLNEDYGKTVKNLRNNMKEINDLVIKENEKYKYILKEKEAIILKQTKELAEKVLKSDYDKDIAIITRQRDVCETHLKKKEMDIELLMHKLDSMVSKSEHTEEISLLTKDNEKYNALLEDKESTLRELNVKFSNELQTAINDIIQTFKISEEEKMNYTYISEKKDSFIASLLATLASSVHKSDYDDKIALLCKERDMYKALIEQNNTSKNQTK